MSAQDEPQTAADGIPTQQARPLAYAQEEEATFPEVEEAPRHASWHRVGAIATMVVLIGVIAAASIMLMSWRSHGGKTPSAASPYASLVGKWTRHAAYLTVSANGTDGTVELVIPDEPACPDCPSVMMPYATIHIGLTAYDAADGTVPDGKKFYGYVKDSSDTRLIPVGVPAEVDVMSESDFYSRMGSNYSGPRPGPNDPPTPGRVITISISAQSVNNDRVGGPFCDEASARRSVCGA